MLSPRDVHYIVGFLSLAAGPDNVEIELGDFVYDHASRTRRDVDITIRIRNADGSQTAFRGLEVKAHQRPLTSEHVEQLIQKLGDMPAITDRAIVSASGFTKPAIRKAEHHGVDLYELADWNPATGFDHFKAETCPAARESYRWIGNVEARINPQREHTETEREVLQSNPRMRFDASPDVTQDLQTWVEHVKQLAAKEATRRTGPVPRNATHHTNLSITVQFSDAASAIRGDISVPIDAIRFTGVFERVVEELPSLMKVLRKVGSSEPIAGCAISDFGGEFGLIALIISKRRTLELARVPIADGNKRKILGQHLRHGTQRDSGESDGIGV